MRRGRSLDWIVFAYLCGFASAVANGQWYDYSPPGSVNEQGTLQDVLSRCDDAGRRAAYDADRVTYCHELTHQVNARIRNSLGGRVNAFYVGGGRAMILQEPNVRLETVAQYVQPAYRNSAYQLYLVDQRSGWDNQPLYVLDEWTAYCNGSQAARELNADDHGSHERASWFCHFADCLIQAVQQHDRTYQQLSALIEFVSWQKQRVSILVGSKLPEPTRPLQRVRDLFVPQPSQTNQLADLAPELRQRNRASSCVHASTVNMLRYLGLHDQAQQYWSRYQGGEWPSRHKKKLDAMGIRYAVTVDGDDSLLEWAVTNRRPAGVTWGRQLDMDHMLNLMGRENGEAVLLGNNVTNEYRREPWAEFLRNWRISGGWAVVLLDGMPPPPTPG